MRRGGYFYFVTGYGYKHAIESVDVNSQSHDLHFQKFFRLIGFGHFFCPFFLRQKNFQS